MSRHAELAAAYFERRAAGDTAGCLELVDPDVVMISDRDGTFEGLEQFKKASLQTLASFTHFVRLTFDRPPCSLSSKPPQYLTKVPPSGTWKDEEIIVEGDKVIKTGKIRWAMMNFSVKSELSFNNEGKITKIVSGRA